MDSVQRVLTGALLLSGRQDVALVELSGSDSEDEEEEETSEDESDSDEEFEITEQNLKLPGDKSKKRANIQVVDQQGA